MQQKYCNISVDSFIKKYYKFKEINFYENRFFNEVSDIRSTFNPSLLF